MLPESIQEIIKRHGIATYPKPIAFKVAQAREKLEAYARAILPSFEWNESYQPIADWLADNQGKGLFVYGNCGVGKTFLCTYVIPAILAAEGKLYFKTYSATELDADKLRNCKAYGIDDLGIEPKRMDYGERHDVAAELIDAAERNGALLVITSNFGADKLGEWYGARTLDRIKHICKRVTINGNSNRR